MCQKLGLSNLLRGRTLLFTSIFRAFAIGFILKICKIAGSRLAPHIPEIVEVLLDSLTSLEPAQFNYLAFRKCLYVR